MEQRRSLIAGFALLVLMVVYIQASVAEGDVPQMKEEHNDVLEYYAQSGIMTDPKEYSELLDTLPTEISELCAVVQGLIIHTYWAKRYGIDLPEERKKEVNIRSAAYMLDRIQVSELALAGNEAFQEIRSIYTNHDRLCMEAGWDPMAEDAKLVRDIAAMENEKSEKDGDHD